MAYIRSMAEVLGKKTMEQCTALLGRLDTPTDAVEKYCYFLSEALRPLGFQLHLERVNWAQVGWRRSLRELRRMAERRRGDWAFVQYTALAWSSHGFPLRFHDVLRSLRLGGMRIAVVFHDAEPYSGMRLIDGLRRWSQLVAMRKATLLADAVIFTVPQEKITWAPVVRGRAVFIPVGANLTVPPQQSLPCAANHLLVVGVFSITGGQAGAVETGLIINAVRFAAKTFGNFILRVFGRHAELREKELSEGLRDSPVEISVEGVLEEKGVVERLTSCDVLLFVRGPISTRRSSAIAGIACGLPIIAYCGTETSPPITEAGVVFYDPQNPESLGETLLRVLQDEQFRKRLAEGSRRAQEQYFSWEAIASRYAEFLK
jgi:glycosyltransferase involved in cell wall biosynthesis